MNLIIIFNTNIYIYIYMLMLMSKLSRKQPKSANVLEISTWNFSLTSTLSSVFR